MTDSMTDRLNAALEGRYQIQRTLGEGGMATVFLADDLKHNREVAIKVLKPDLAAVVGSERFLAEIETTANLTHPHILPLHDSGDADGFLFYVMPYIDGESLRDRLDREKQLSVEEAVGIAAKISGALEAAHRAGVVHRDIKPANILLADGEPLVADFGIALAVQEAGAGRLTETGLSMGTPLYMSPEQATADRAVSPATDVYSLGCVLYEMLVGEPPYVGNTAQAVLGKILTDEPRRPTMVRSAIRPNVEAAILRALEKLPADRFATAGEFLRALEDPGFRHGEDAGDGLGAPGGVSSAWRWATGVVGAAAVVLGMLLVGDTTPPAETVRFDVTLPADVSLYTGDGVQLALSPDGSSLIFVATGEGSADLWIRRFDRLAPQPVPGTSEALNPRFSPDGRAIVFTRDGTLVRAGLEGAPPLTLVSDSVASGAGGVAWGDDGFIYFVIDGTLRRIPEEGGLPERVVDRTEGGNAAAWPEALPGGSGLLFTRDGGTPSNDTIQVMDLDTREVRTLFPGAMARWSSSGHIVYADGGGTLFAVPFDPDRLEVTGAHRPVAEGIQVNTGSATQFALSASGSLAYAGGDAGSYGVPVWLDGGGSPEAIPGFRSEGFLINPAVSPSGGKFAVAQSQTGERWDIWVMDVDDGAFSRITFEGNNTRPFWHPDGEEVGFLRENSEGAAGLYSRPIDLSTPARPLWTPDDYLEVNPIIGSWTRNGERLIALIDYDRFVTVSPHPDSTPLPLVDPPGRVRSFDLSPDGGWLAYDSDQSDGMEVYAHPFPGPGGQRQLSSAGGLIPRWLPTGDALMYVVNEGAVTSWVRAGLRGVSDPSVVSRSTIRPDAVSFLGDPRVYDVAPDGRILAIDFGAAGGATGRPVVVTNWIAELARDDGW